MNLIYPATHRRLARPLVLRLLTTLVIVALTMTAGADSARPEPQIARYAGHLGYTPLFFEQSGGLVGIVPDMVNEVMSKYGYDLENIAAPRNRSIAMVMKGLAEITSVQIYPPLVLNSNYPSNLTICPTPLLTEEIVLIAAVHHDTTIKPIEEMKLGWVNAINNPKILQALGLNPSQVGLYHSNDALVKALLTKRIDGAITTMSATLYVLHELGSPVRMATLKYFGKSNLHLAMSESFSQRAASQNICEEITRLQNSGRLAQIYLSYMNPEMVSQTTSPAGVQ